MNPPENAFKRRLRDGEKQIGIFATIADPTLIELLLGGGFDWIVIDTEHAATELPGVIDRLRVLDGEHAEAIVRPATSDPVILKRLLDAGARTLLIPSIESAEQAALAVASTRYPPEGIRGVSGITRAAGFGQDPSYVRRAADELCVIVQIESAAGLGNLEAIASTSGVDAVFIGPADLAATMGHLGDTQHPEVQAAVDDAFARLAALGVPSGYLTLNLDEAVRRMPEPIAVMGVASDTSIANLGLAALRSALGAHREGTSGS